MARFPKNPGPALLGGRCTVAWKDLSLPQRLGRGCSPSRGGTWALTGAQGDSLPPLPRRVALKHLPPGRALSASGSGHGGSGVSLPTRGCFSGALRTLGGPRPWAQIDGAEDATLRAPCPSAPDPALPPGWDVSPTVPVVDLWQEKSRWREVVTNPSSDPCPRQVFRECAPASRTPVHRWDPLPV